MLQPNKVFLISLSLFVSSFIFVNQAHAEKYELLMSKDDGLCQHVQMAFREDIKKNVFPKPNRYKVYDWAKWEVGYYYLNTPTDRIVILQSSFDIDNDGKLETVVNYLNRIDWERSEELLVFDNPAPDFNSGLIFTDEEYNQLSGVKSSKEWPYKIQTNLFDADPEYHEKNNILGSITIHPLFYKDKYYLSLIGKSKADDRPNWHIIALYSNEHFMIGGDDPRKTSKLEHLCYFDTNDRGEPPGSKSKPSK